MSIPSSDRNEYVVSSLGVEDYPQGILVKGSLWSLQLSYNRLLLKEYEGNLSIIDFLLIDKYVLTPALKLDLTIDTNRFWVWSIDLNNNLSLYEFEPFVDSTPELTYYKTGLSSNVNSVDVYVRANDGIRIITLYNTNELKAIVYENIRLSDPSTISDLTWSTTRLNQFSNFINFDKTQLDIAYLDVLSPPDVYIEGYSIAAPTNLTLSQVGDTNNITINWDASLLADQYLLQRDTTPFFTSPVSIISPINSYLDTAPSINTYYYRVKAQNSGLLIESFWSSIESITLVISDFVGIPTELLIGNSVQFTDLSTATPDTWDWNFGDGSPHSTEQNPLHIYNDSGTFTVILTVTYGVKIAQKIRYDYIKVYPNPQPPTIDGMITISERDPDNYFNLIEKEFNYFNITPKELFFGITGIQEEIIQYRWEFGDGGTSTFKRPSHIYDTYGYHGVFVQVKGHGVTWMYVGDTTKEKYVVLGEIEVYGDPRRGDKPLPVDLDSRIETPTGSYYTGWQWDYGDGQGVTGMHIQDHTYEEYGIYDVGVDTNFNEI